MKERIASEIGVVADLLDTDQVQNVIDDVLIRHMEDQPTQKIVSENSKETTTIRKMGKNVKKTIVAAHDEQFSKKPKADKRTINKESSSEKLSKKSLQKLSNITEKSSKTTKESSEAAIVRLKTYIFRCGVRRIWKRELENMSDRQIIQHLGDILKELGIVGRPTLEKCKAIKERREFEEELKAVQGNAILSKRLRSRGDDAHIHNLFPNSTELDDYNDGFLGSSKNVSINKTERLDLSAFGDPEVD